MERVYDALVAQLELAIHHYDRGLVIKVSGFNHKLHVILLWRFLIYKDYFNNLILINISLQLLISAIVEQFARFEVNVVEEVFEALREQQEKAYRNYCLKPSKLIT